MESSSVKGKPNASRHDGFGSKTAEVRDHQRRKACPLHDQHMEACMHFNFSETAEGSRLQVRRGRVSMKVQKNSLLSPPNFLLLTKSLLQLSIHLGTFGG
jgi:hypothetical protein